MLPHGRNRPLGTRAGAPTKEPRGPKTRSGGHPPLDLDFGSIWVFNWEPKWSHFRCKNGPTINPALKTLKLRILHTFRCSCSLLFQLSLGMHLCFSCLPNNIAFDCVPQALDDQRGVASDAMRVTKNIISQIIVYFEL